MGSSKERQITQLWGGRFRSEPATDLREFGDSIAFDRRLWRQEILVNRVHAQGLHEAGLLTPDELVELERALDKAEALFESGEFPIDGADEDIHSAVERYLTEHAGVAGLRIHAGRSRNDMVVTELRLWMRPRVASIAKGVYELQQALYRLAREHVETVAPGYTHLQRAQPILLAHHLLAHAFALARDFERMVAAYRRCDVSTLGAAALAGTSIPIDPAASQRKLGFRKLFDNAADAVGSRDFVLEFLATGAILGTTLSRLAEEIVLWTTSEFGYATLDDSYSTGSSIMPQKKNPDGAELVRARSARITAHLVHLLGVVKGLPLTYNRDLQEDKVPVFDTADSLLGMLRVLRGSLQTIHFDSDRLKRAAQESASSATDLADALVGEGVPFRVAHEAVGKLVAESASDGGDLSRLTEEQLRAAHEKLTKDMVNSLDVDGSIASRSSHGGTAPLRVAEQISRLENFLDDEERWLAGYANE